jgi:protein-S-isoprenylcysteine O-methyltransferase Ste14
MIVAASFIAYVLLFATLLFGGAGTIDWARGWVLLAVLAVIRGVGTISLYRFNRLLLEERSYTVVHRDQPWSDRVLLPLFMASFAAMIAFAGWDGFRGRLLPSPPIWLRPLGLVAFAAGWVIIYFVLRANAFATTVVRDQSERRQELADTGPYAVVRHPMYASMWLVIPGMCLWLGSTAGILLTVVPMLILAVRIHFEEAFLERALPAYRGYQERVRWRLIPFAW